MLLVAPDLFNAANLESRLEAFVGEPAKVHFQSIRGGACRTVIVFGLRLHVLDIDDFALRIEKRHG